MRANTIKRNFYQRNTLKVAQDLLGCFLVRKIGSRIIRGIITETEAYIGEDDLACHASKGRTPRTEVMYGEAGHAYVYLIYGMYYCLNVVTGKKDFPAAVLIRGIKPPKTFRPEDSTRKSNLDSIVLNGPGKICRLFKIDKKLNGWDMTKGRELWMEKGIKFKDKDIEKSKRIGVDYAGHWRHYLWRFHLDFQKNHSKLLRSTLKRR